MIIIESRFTIPYREEGGLRIQNLFPEGRTIWGNLLHIFNSAEGFEPLFNYGSDNRPQTSKNQLRLCSVVTAGVYEERVNYLHTKLLRSFQVMMQHIWLQKRAYLD